MFIVGLTGGIASGKTTVSNLFAELGVPIIDADIAAREVVQPDSLGIKQLVEQFGTGILTDAGELMRPKLRELIFSDDQLRKKAESIIHPLVRNWMEQQAKQHQDKPYAIFVIPLLFETGRYDSIVRVVVVDTPEQTQIERVMARDGISADQAKKILAAQLPREKRLSLADDVISNNKDSQQLAEIVHQLHLHYLQLAK